jgi:hypothetical protein
MTHNSFSRRRGQPQESMEGVMTTNTADRRVTTGSVSGEYVVLNEGPGVEASIGARPRPGLQGHGRSNPRRV